MGDGSGCPPLIGAVGPSVARRYLRYLGADWDEDMLESALLVTSELVTNAMLHGGDPTTLDVRTSAGTMRLEVYDSGRTPPAWLGLTGDGLGNAGGVRSDDDLSLDGRGLHIVETLSERWGVRQQPPGKVV